METLCLSEFRETPRGNATGTSVRARQEIMHRQTSGECVVHNLVDRFLRHNLLPIELYLRRLKHHPFQPENFKAELNEENSRALL